MTVRVAAIALGQIAAVVTAALASAAALADVSIACWRAHPGIDQDNQKPAKLLREK